MTEQEKVDRAKKMANKHAGTCFDQAWDNILSEDCNPWQRESVEMAFKIGFFEGLGYAGKILNDATEDE